MSVVGNQGLRLGIVGATGVVGTQLLELIYERAFPFSVLKLFSSENHVGSTLEAGGQEHRVLVLDDPAELSDLDLVFLAVHRPTAEAVQSGIAGPIVVDLSSAILAPSAIPFVAPGFSSREHVRDQSSVKLFHLPHPAALALATILHTLGEQPFCASTLMFSASSMGHGAISRLVEQSADLLNGRLDLKEEEMQSAFNAALFPDGPRLEAVLFSQIARLIGRSPQLVLRTVAVSVLHGTAISVNLPNTADGDSSSALLRAAPGVLLVENDEPPSVVDAIGQEALLLSLASGGTGRSVWCVFDNARRAGLAALWIAECLVPPAVSKLN